MYRKGFTVVELLVVLVIAGLLAALLLPVFGQARAKAQTRTCLSNVRALAQAIQLYNDDWGRLFPDIADQTAIDYFNHQQPGWHGGHICNRSRKGNPYLRPQVILASYLSSPSLWRCPQATLEGHPEWIVPAGRDGYWLNNYRDDPHWRKGAGGPCHYAFPPGWGGDLTDSFVQGPRLPPQQLTAGGFAMSIAPNDSLNGLVPDSMSEPGKYIVVADGGTFVPVIYEAVQVAFPQRKMAALTTDPESGCCTPDWINCSWSRNCGLTTEQKHKVLAEAKFRRSLTRHHGGVNLGFLDGHAAWVSSDVLITAVAPFPKPKFAGLDSIWPTGEARPALDKSARPPSPSRGEK